MRRKKRLHGGKTHLSRATNNIEKGATKGE